MLNLSLLSALGDASKVLSSVKVSDFSPSVVQTIAGMFDQTLSDQATQGVVSLLTSSDPSESVMDAIKSGKVWEAVLKGKQQSAQAAGDKIVRCPFCDNLHSVSVS